MIFIIQLLMPKVVYLAWTLLAASIQLFPRPSLKQAGVRRSLPPRETERARPPASHCTAYTRSPMIHTPEDHEPGTAVGGLGKRARVHGSPILGEFPPDILVILAKTLGNPLGLLVSKAHLSTSFHEAACAALAILESVELSKWSRTVDDAAVAAVASKCPQLSSLDLSSCGRITDAAVKARRRWPRGASCSCRST